MQLNLETRFGLLSSTEDQTETDRRTRGDFTLSILPRERRGYKAPTRCSQNRSDRWH
jgi:hypothetical protein